MRQQEATASSRTQPQRKEEEWQRRSADIVIGKDILELLSSSMYVDPMTIFREYVQNAADSIDEARRQNLFPAKAGGRVDIHCDARGRSIRIRDNGTGIAARDFEARLTSFGASAKRGTASRGFRGVGRLAGLGYCQELIFRARASGEARVSELKWDCRKLKEALRAPEFSGDLTKLVGEVVSHRRVSGDNYPDHFFEVELKAIVRHRNDRLLNPNAVYEYLSQVGPVPFSPEFPFAKKIAESLAPHVAMGNVDVRIDGLEGPVFRPYRRAIEIGENVYDPYLDVEIRELPSADGGIAAVAWVLHHGYTGAIPAKSLVKGLRLRSGNIQVGDGSILEEWFPETRFNAWSVGEIHVIDPRIMANGRRDHFEQGTRFDDLLNKLGVLARDIARRCRDSSIQRKRQRDFELAAAAVREKLSILAQGTLAKRKRAALVGDIQTILGTMEKAVASDSFPSGAKIKAGRKLRSLQLRLDRLMRRVKSATPLSRLSQGQRSMYEHLFSLIYECSANKSAAKSLVDRILVKIA